MLNPTQPLLYLLLYLGVLYLRPHEFVPALMNLPIQPVLLLTALVVWLLRQPKNLTSPQFWILPALLVQMSLAVAVVVWFGEAQAVFSDFAPVVLLFFMLATTVDSMQRLRQVFLVLAICITVIAIHGVDQAARGIGWTGAELSQESRITYLGFLNDPNDLAMALVMTLPMVLYLARGASFLMRQVWRAAAGVVLYAVYLTNSRGSVLAVAAMFSMYAVIRFGWTRSVFVLPLLLVPILVLGPSRMSEMSADEESAEGRIQAWYEGVQLFLQHPLLGVGKGQFVDHNWLTAHNSFVLAFAELGITGYVLWLSNIVLTWIMVRQIMRLPQPETAVAATDDASRRSPDADGPPGARAVPTWADLQDASRTLWYGLVGGLVSAFFLSRSYVVILYIHIALVVAVHQIARSSYPGLPAVTFGQRKGRLFAGALFSIFALWLLTKVLISRT